MAEDNGSMSRISMLREEQRLSRKLLADLADVPVNSLANMERTRTLVIRQLERLAAVLGVSPSYLCGWSEDRSGHVRVEERIVTVPVIKRTYLPTIQIPEYWKVEDGQLIRWTCRGKSV